MGDLISRKALLDKIMRNIQSNGNKRAAQILECLLNAPAVEVAPTQIQKVETNIYDKEEIYENCTVQVLTNTVTGEVSVGWWRNE